MRDIYSDYVHAIRFALEGKPQEASLLAKRSLSSLSKTSPELAHVVTNLLAQFSSAKPVRGNVAGALPIDMDSRMELAIYSALKN